MFTGLVLQTRQRGVHVLRSDGERLADHLDGPDLPSVRRIHVGPLRRHRAQPPLGVEEHHTILTPVLLARGQHQALTVPGMEGVRDFNLYGCAAR